MHSPSPPLFSTNQNSRQFRPEYSSKAKDLNPKFSICSRDGGLIVFATLETNEAECDEEKLTSTFANELFMRWIVKDLVTQ
jgi:hypothetical protein